MAAYTCITCRIMFSGKEVGVADGLDPETRAAAMQKEHYKTDWHRYNLKRKVAELPPVTAENFHERIIAHKNQVAEEGKNTSCRCDACGKHFSTSNAYTNHLQSKRHKDAVAAECGTGAAHTVDVQRLNAKNKSAVVCQGERRAAKDATNAQLKMATQGAPLGAANAAQGGVALGSVAQGGVAGQRVAGRADRHVEALFSDVTSTADDEWEDVDEEEMKDGDEVEEEEGDDWSAEALSPSQCLFCPHASHSLDANIKHMTIAHSFFIPDVEYLVDLDGLMACLGEKVGALRMCLWCNERSRVFTEIKAVQQHMTDKGHCKLLHEGDAVLEYADFYDYRSSYPDYKTRAGKAAERGDEALDDDDEEVESSASATDVQDNGFQLVLPSGSTVGHRTLQRYYRQKLRPGRELVVSANSSSVSKVMAQYKSLGWLGTTGAAAMQKAKDISYVNRMKSRYSMHLGVKANKLQRHFRDDNFGNQ